MSRIYKICVVNNLTESAGEVFAVKPYLESFDSFKDEIFIRMPELKNQPLKIYYQDADGDKITIFNALDFAIFQEQKINKVFVVKGAPTKSVQFQEIVAPSVSNTPIASNSTSSNRMHHANVVCDGCDKEIYGYRYKCLECHDFDLCMECEPKQHNHHLMIRIADPSDAEICYRSKLGKRFLRHRRSESLCAKDEKIAKHHHNPHHHGHKRQSLGVSARRPNSFFEQVIDVLHGVNTPNQNANAPNVTPAQGTNNGNEKKTGCGTSSKATPSAPPTAPSYGFNFCNNNGNAKPKSPCVPLKQSIDMLSHMAQNFATMMDPFGAYMESLASANHTASSAATSAATAKESAKAAATAAEAAAAAATSAKATENVASPKENVSASAENNEQKVDEDASMTNQEPSKVSDAIVIDCSDDEDEDLRNMVLSLNVNSTEANKEASNDAIKKDESVESIENEKASPSREWTFIESNEIDESAGASGSSTGAIPKKSTPPPAQNSGSSNNVDYAELSRLLSTHIDAQKQNQTTVPPQTDEQAKTDVTDGANENAVKLTKTPPPTPLHPDARVNESLTAMMAMGFSNEGGWLTQLLETVDGNISNALDLLQPHK
ncbi:sequestosome-1 [Contarinia nasturtii]|uniref:sequestosome-1 n=1 Tax=Contarinia nasturtii TaxID=265458 RepID=UPI0012D453A2|nr:sequestosome-1 [Contarinia nasturtii]